MKDQTAVRAIEENIPEELQPVMTTNDKNTKATYREKAIRQIESRFEQSKKIKVGMPKSAEQPHITAVKVIDFLPLLHLMGNKFNLAVCDDIMEDELKQAKGRDPAQP